MYTLYFRLCYGTESTHHRQGLGHLIIQSFGLNIQYTGTRSVKKDRGVNVSSTGGDVLFLRKSNFQKLRNSLDETM